MTFTPLTRREFLGSLAVVSTAATIPVFLGRSAPALAAPAGAMVKDAPGVPTDRILVVVQLSGGNDGLNTVVPFGSREYYDLRPGIAVGEDSVLRVDDVTGIGLHPQMAAFKDLIDDGVGAVVQGVGYPNPNRSHFASMDIYHTGDTAGGRGLGWLGKALDHVDFSKHPGAAATAMVSLGREAPLAGQGKRIRAVSFERADLFRWAGADLHPLLARAYDDLNRTAVPSANQANDPDNQAAFVRRTGLDAQVASDRIRKAVAAGPVSDFPANSGLARQLRMVASMIRAELPTRVYYVGHGGFDTHAGQPNRHGRLIEQFAEAMRAFQHELNALGQDQRVLTLAFSEFGRRARQNSSNGTDHGAAGPMFMAGPMIRPGLLGDHPSLANLDRNGDLVYNVDFRNIYATVLDQWMGSDSNAVLGKSYRHTNVLDGKLARG